MYVTVVEPEIRRDLMEPVSPAPEELIHPTYLPFTAVQLRQHFAPVDGRSREELERHVQYFTDSAERYKQFCAPLPKREGASLGSLKLACQIEKDERFWAASCWLSIFHHPRRVELLSTLMKGCFGKQPPVGGLNDWCECFTGDLRLYFETHLPSPQSYKRWLSLNLQRRNLVPYVLASASRANENLEGPTHADVLLVNADNGFALLIEAKVVSDISYGVSFDVMRNQLARTIDVSLDAHPALPPPLSARRPDRTLIVLQTPKMFQKAPESRLYGWLLNSYRSDPSALCRDLPHRTAAEIGDVSKRLGWLTWEDCRAVLPSCCAWLGA